MPKLRKHSQLKQQNKLTEDQDSTSAKDKQNNSKLDGSDKQPLSIVGKLKYKDRLYMIEEYQKHSLNNENSNNDNAISQKSNQINDDQVAAYLNTLPDDDLKQSTNELITTQITKKLKIKKANKFFNNFQLQNQALQEKQQSQDNQIRIERKQTKGAAHLMQKTMLKALTFKNRLSFKDMNKDDKFKNNIKDKLKSLETVQQIEICVEIPKILGGRKSHVEAALFLKNNRDSVQNKINSSNTPQAEQIKQQSCLPKDRKNYYEDLQRQIKLKRAQSLTQSAMKQCFKKIYLDETDFIYDLQQKKTIRIKNNTINRFQRIALLGQIELKFSHKIKSKALNKFKSNRITAICQPNKQKLKQIINNNNQKKIFQNIKNYKIKKQKPQKSNTKTPRRQRKEKEPSIYTTMFNYKHKTPNLKTKIENNKINKTTLQEKKKTLTSLPSSGKIQPILSKKRCTSIRNSYPT